MKSLAVLSLSLASAAAFSPSTLSSYRGLNAVQQSSKGLVCKADALSTGPCLAQTRQSSVALKAKGTYLDRLNKQNKRKSSWGGKDQKTYLDRINKRSYNPLLIILAFPFTASFQVVKFAVDKVSAAVLGVINLVFGAFLFVWNQVLRRIGRVVGGIGSNFAVGVLSFFSAGSAFIAGLFSGGSKEKGPATQTLDRVRVAEAIQAGSGNYLEMLESESSQEYGTRIGSAPGPETAQAPAYVPPSEAAPAAAPSGSYLDRLGSSAPTGRINTGSYLDNLGR